VNQPALRDDEEVEGSQGMLRFNNNPISLISTVLKAADERHLPCGAGWQHSKRVL
jgi:hypothetical protein